MGQKVNAVAIRLGITREWVSKWYAGKKLFPQHVYTDFQVRQFLKTKLADASVSRILIDRAAKRVNITIQTARPGIVIGKKGEDIEKLRAETAKMLKLPPQDVRLNIAEIRKPELDAQLVADGIAQQIEKRDAVGDQLRIELGLADLGDVQAHVLRRQLEHLGRLGAQLLDVLTLLADHDARTRGLDRDVDALGGAVDEDAADRRVGELGLQELAHLEIGVHVLREQLLARIPLGHPLARDA